MSLLEYFLDEHQNELSPDMFHALDSLAGEIDKEVDYLETQLADLEKNKEGYEEQISELEEKIDELEAAE